MLFRSYVFFVFLFVVVPSLLYFCFADAFLHLAVFLNIFSLTYQKKKAVACSEQAVEETTANQVKSIKYVIGKLSSYDRWYFQFISSCP